MKRIIPRVITVLMLSSTVAWAHPGQAAYDKMCKSCHGVDGAGNEAKAKMLKLDPAKLNLGRPEGASLTKDDLKKIILEGKDKMPSYAKKLTAAEVDPVVDLTAELAKAIREKK